MMNANWQTSKHFLLINTCLLIPIGGSALGLTGSTSPLLAVEDTPSTSRHSLNLPVTPSSISESSTHPKTPHVTSPSGHLSS